MGNLEVEKAKAEQKLQTLQFQNGKLSAQLEVQRSQIAELESRIEAQDAKQSAYADTLLTVNSLWSQLNADVQHLATRASKVCDAAIQHLTLKMNYTCLYTLPGHLNHGRLPCNEPGTWSRGSQQRCSAP
jgi:chromosome segregation ATPase